MIIAVVKNNKQTRHSGVFKLIGLLLLVIFTCRTVVYTTAQKLGSKITTAVQDQANADDSQDDDTQYQSEFVIMPHHVHVLPVSKNLVSTCFSCQMFSFNTQHYLAVLTPPPNC